MLVETTHLTEFEYYISLVACTVFYRESWQNDICSFRAVCRPYSEF